MGCDGKLPRMLRPPSSLLLPGALIMTGANLYDIFALLAAYGVGFEYHVSAGIMVQTGINLYIFVSVTHSVRWGWQG